MADGSTPKIEKTCRKCNKKIEEHHRYGFSGEDFCSETCRAIHIYAILKTNKGFEKHILAWARRGISLADRAKNSTDASLVQNNRKNWREFDRWYREFLAPQMVRAVKSGETHLCQEVGKAVVISYYIPLDDYLTTGGFEYTASFKTDTLGKSDCGGDFLKHVRKLDDISSEKVLLHIWW